MEQIITVFDKYGLPGITMCALLGIIVYMLKEQKLLINDHHAQIKSITDQFLGEMEKRSNAHAEERQQLFQAFRENTEVLRGITSKCGAKVGA